MPSRFARVELFFGEEDCVFELKIEQMIEFKQTLFPVPVRPAISRWGSPAKSTDSGLPETSGRSLPRNSRLGQKPTAAAGIAVDEPPQ